MYFDHVNHLEQPSFKKVIASNSTNFSRDIATQWKAKTAEPVAFSSSRCDWSKSVLQNPPTSKLQPIFVQNPNQLQLKLIGVREVSAAVCACVKCSGNLP